MKKALFFLALLAFIGTSISFGQDEMIYYEKHYQAHLEKVSQQIREEIISYLHNRIRDFNVDDLMSRELGIYLEKCASYDEIDPMAFVRDWDISFSKIWTIKGKVFSRKDISKKLDSYSNLFENLNSLKGVRLIYSTSGELEKGFSFVLIFFAS